jgi:hypothetical protein
MWFHRRLAFVPFFLILGFDLNVQAATIDFESLSVGTPVTNQFLSQGLRMESAGPESGFVISKGTLDISAAMESSGTQVVLLGAADAPVTLWFVDRANSAKPRGVFFVAVTFGYWEGPSVASIEYLDRNGNVFTSSGAPITTNPPFRFDTYRSDSRSEIEQLAYGVRLTNTRGRAVAIDDISFTLLPEPNASGLMALCVIGSGAYAFGQRTLRGKNVH